MGEYADDLINAGMMEEYPFGFGRRRTYSATYVSKKPKYDRFEFKRIIRETDRAWYLEMSGGWKKWFPKQYCFIVDDILSIPEWLTEKITADEGKKIEINNKKERGKYKTKR